MPNLRAFRCRAAPAECASAALAQPRHPPRANASRLVGCAGSVGRTRSSTIIRTLHSLCRAYSRRMSAPAWPTTQWTVIRDYLPCNDPGAFERGECPLLALTDETQRSHVGNWGITRLVMLALSFVESDPCRHGYWDFDVRSLGKINQDGLLAFPIGNGPMGGF